MIGRIPPEAGESARINLRQARTTKCIQPHPMIPRGYYLEGGMNRFRYGLAMVSSVGFIYGLALGFPLGFPSLK